MSSNQPAYNVSQAAAMLLLLTVISKLIGFFREVVFAHNFGLGSEYDIYLVGSVIPITIITIYNYIIQNYVIPLYKSIEVDSDKNRINAFMSRIIIKFTLHAGIISIFLLLIKKLVFNYYFKVDAHSFDLLNSFYLVYIFSIPINIWYSVFSSLLQAKYKFRVPAFAQVVSGAIMVIIVLLFTKPFGIYSIILGYILGLFIQIGYLAIFFFKENDFLFTLNPTAKSENYMRNSGLIVIIITESISQLYLLSDRYFLDYVDKGGIAVLNYSTNLFSLPISAITISFTLAVFPKLSYAYSVRNFDEIFGTINKYFKMVVVFLMPITFIFYFWGENIIKIIFQRGNFSPHDSFLTYSTFKFYIISLIPYSIYAGINKLYYSINWNTKLLLITIISVLAKILFNFILVLPYKQDGLAISTSVSYLLIFLMSIVLLKYYYSEFNLSKIFYLAVVYLVIASICMLILFTIKLISPIYCNHNFILEIIMFLTLFVGTVLVIDSDITLTTASLKNILTFKR